MEVIGDGWRLDTAHGVQVAAGGVGGASPGDDVIGLAHVADETAVASFGGVKLKNSSRQKRVDYHKFAAFNASEKCWTAAFSN